MDAILFDLGGTYLRAAYIQNGGELQLLTKTEILTFLHENNESVIWKKIIHQIIDYIAQIKDVVSSSAPIVFSFPGPIDEKGIILSAPTVIGSSTKMPDLKHEISNLTNREVYMINDISAASWRMSELFLENRLLIITVSSGIGSKFFDRNHPNEVFDNLPYSGEIGHCTVDLSDSAPICDCGGKGHLGAISSGRGIERYAKNIARKNYNNFSKSLCVKNYQATPDTLSNELHLVPALLEGDKWAEQVIYEASLPLAQQIVAINLAISVEKTIIIGGFALAGGISYLNLLRRALKSSCDYSLLKDKITDLVVLGNQENEMCLRGTRSYVIRKLAK